MKKNIKYVVTTALLLSACDTKDRTPLPGVRESFLTTTSSLKADSTSLAKINLSGSTSLPKELKEVFVIQTGTGESSGQRILSAPIIQNNVAYTIDAKGLISAYKLDFKEKNQPSYEKKWSFSSSPEDLEDAALGGGIAVTSDNSKIYITTSFGEIIALDAQKGTQIWRKDGFTPFRSKPVIHDDLILAQSISNELVAISPTDGSRLWSHNGLPETAQLLTCSNPTVAFDTVIVTYSSGEVHALNIKTGQVMWSDTVTPVARIDTVTGIPHIAATPVVYDQQLFVISHGGRMTSLDIKTGARQWQKEIGGTQTPVIEGNYVFVLTNLSEIVCLDKKSGNIIWVNKLHISTKDDPHPTYQGPVLSGNELIITSSKGQLIRINAEDGSIKTKTDVNETIFLPPVLDKNTVYVLTTDSNLHAFK